jgi:hypothetical protein
MVRIAITPAAYAAIKATLPPSAAIRPLERTTNGKVFVHLDRRAIDRLTAERRRGENLSDTIVRLASKCA